MTTRLCVLTCFLFLLLAPRAWSQDVNSLECRMAQQAAQQAVTAGQPYKVHGQMVATAARAASGYAQAGTISTGCESCIVSQFARRVPIATQDPCGPVDNWMIAFTNRGTVLPATAVDFMCDTVPPAIASWLEREAANYQQPLPFSNIACVREQLFLGPELLGTCPFCLNEPATIAFVEDAFQSVREATLATVVHYLDESEHPFYDYTYNLKYDFYFFRIWPGTPFGFYPELDVNNQGETLIHEFMHKLGASDKYWDGWEHACQIDPATGQEYSGYDIMCHRVGDPDRGYSFPPLSELVVTEPTAKEIGWMSY